MPKIATYKFRVEYTDYSYLILAETTSDAIKQATNLRCINIAPIRVTKLP
jgi:hypothetical protein